MQAGGSLNFSSMTTPPSPVEGGDCLSNMGSPILKKSKPSVDDQNINGSPCWQGSDSFLGGSSASSSGSSGVSHPKSENSKNMDADPQKSNPALPVFAFDPTKGCFIPRNTFDTLPEELKVSTVNPNESNKFFFSNYCLCRGLYFKKEA